MARQNHPQALQEENEQNPQGKNRFMYCSSSSRQSSELEIRVKQLLALVDIEWKGVLEVHDESLTKQEKRTVTIYPSQPPRNLPGKILDVRQRTPERHLFIIHTNSEAISLDTEYGKYLIYFNKRE